MKILSLAQREIHLGLQSFVIQAPPVPLNTTVNTKFCLLFLIYCQWTLTEKQKFQLFKMQYA